MFYQEERKNQEKRNNQEISKSWNNSESAFQVKTPESREKKRDLSGYESYRTKQDRIKESLRFENSYGTVAFGGDKGRGLTILAAEKRRHNSEGITGKEKRLSESRQREHPMGRGKTVANAGGQKEGAFAFAYQPEVSRFEMMERMKQYLADHGQETVQRLLPFLKTKGEEEHRQSVEQAARTMREQGLEDRAGRLDKLKEENGRGTQQKGQMETAFNQKLVQAIKDMKKEPGKDGEKRVLKEQLSSLLFNALKEAVDSADFPDPLPLSEEGTSGEGESSKEDCL